MEIIKKSIRFGERKALKIVGNRILKREFKNKNSKEINERIIEYGFLFDVLRKIKPRTILDVGTGKSCLPALLDLCGYSVVAIDNEKNYWKKMDSFNRHFYVINDDICDTKLEDKFDLVTCISTLEHIKDYKWAMKNMNKLLLLDGYMVLTFPYNENYFSEDVYKIGGCSVENVPYICRSFSRYYLTEMLKLTDLKIMEQQYWKCFSGNLWQFGKRLEFPTRSSEEIPHDLTCILLKKVL